MNQNQWQDVLLSPGNEDHTWGLFHENSKNGRFSMSATDQEVRDHINRLHESLPFEGNMFDFILCSETLEHLDKLDFALS